MIAIANDAEAETEGTDGRKKGGAVIIALGQRSVRLEPNDRQRSPRLERGGIKVVEQVMEDREGMKIAGIPTKGGKDH